MRIRIIADDPRVDVKSCVERLDRRLRPLFAHAVLPERWMADPYVQLSERCFVPKEVIIDLIERSGFKVMPPVGF